MSHTGVRLDHFTTSCTNQNVTITLVGRQGSVGFLSRRRRQEQCKRCAPLWQFRAKSVYRKVYGCPRQQQGQEECLHLVYSVVV